VSAAVLEDHPLHVEPVGFAREPVLHAGGDVGAGEFGGLTSEASGVGRAVIPQVTASRLGRKVAAGPSGAAVMAADDWHA
jgi:hypothetical protein